METTKKVELQLASLQADTVDKERNTMTFHSLADSTKTLVIQIGSNEAQVLAITLQGMQPTAPLPLDLLQNALVEFGYSVKEVLIEDLKNGVYTSKVVCTNNVKEVSLNARTSDAITLAYKFDCPIYASSHLLSN